MDEHADVEQAPPPDPLQQHLPRAVVGEAGLADRGHVARRHRGCDGCRCDRRRRALEVLVGWAVAEIEGQEGLVHAGVLALDEELEAPSPGWVELGVLGEGEQPDLREVGRTFGRDVGQPAVVAIAKADRLLALNQRDPVKDAAAYIARALPRVVAAPCDQHCLLPRLELAGQLLVTALAEQAASDRGDADEPGIELDEGRIGGRRVGPGWRTACAGLGQGPVDVGNGQPERGDRTLGEQRCPVGRCGHRRVDGRRHVG